MGDYTGDGRAVVEPFVESFIKMMQSRWKAAVEPLLLTYCLSAARLLLRLLLVCCLPTTHLLLACYSVRCSYCCSYCCSYRRLNGYRRVVVEPFVEPFV